MAADGFARTFAVSGDTTEWEDILIKKGITTKEDVLLSKGLNPEDFVEKKEVPRIEVTREDLLPYATLEELDELGEEEYSDERTLNEYRQKRLAELKQAQVRNRFGEVVEIVKDDWVREVTECSRSCWVVVHLYHDALVECGILDAAMQQVAPRFRAVKFLKIRSTQAIENWPERNLPTLFLYHDGELKLQLITLTALGGKAATGGNLEWWLASKGIVETELEEDPRHSPGKASVTRVGIFNAKHMTGLDSDDDVDDDDA